MVDLDSNPTKLIEIIEIGKQLLITRGALTTFSIANDVAKYFAIIPAMLGTLYRPTPASHGPLTHFNVMGLHTPQERHFKRCDFQCIDYCCIDPHCSARCPLPCGNCL